MPQGPRITHVKNPKKKTLQKNEVVTNLSPNANFPVITTKEGNPNA